MSTITLPGLASGLDVNALVTNLVAAESAPLTQLNQLQSSVTSATNTISTFSSRLSTLQTAARALATPDGFASNAATSSDTAVAVSASGAAAPGGYDVNVTALAREQRTYSNTFGASTTALGMAGTLQFTVGAGSPVNVTVTATDTLTTISDRINASGSRVTSSVLFDGTSYRLQVRGLDTGAANTIAFNETGTTLGLGVPANTYQTARDAALTVDGIAITRPTNQITGVVPGVTLALARTTTTPARVTVAADPAAMRQKITTFVNAYNDVVNAGHTAAGYGSTKASNTVLAGDRAIRSSLQSVYDATAATVAGATGTYNQLASVGLVSNRDGTLKLDATKFDAALTADPASVASLFTTAAGVGAPQGAMDRVVAAVTGLTRAGAGVIDTRLTALRDQSRRLDDQASRLNDRLEKYQVTLRAQFTAMDQAVARYRNYVIPGSTSSSSSTG